MDFYSSRTNCSLILSAIGNIIEHHTEKIMHWIMNFFCFFV